MIQMEYGSTKGKRKIDTLMEMAEEGIITLKEYYRNEFWFRMKQICCPGHDDKLLPRIDKRIEKYLF